MENQTATTRPTEPLAAYWNATALPAMPQFLRDLIEQAKARLHVSKIMLFGSRARADCHPTSDYDLAFFLVDTQGWEQFVAEQQEEAGTLLPLDLLNVQDAPEALRQDILSSGVTLYAT
jgi:predicted nucleotidyltransferase